MSLIHDALKSMDVSQASEPAIKAAPFAPARARHTGVYALCAFLGVIIVAAAAWYIWQSLKPAPMQRHTAVPETPLVQAMPTQLAMAAVSPPAQREPALAMPAPTPVKQALAVEAPRPAARAVVATQPVPAVKVVAEDSPARVVPSVAPSAAAPAPLQRVRPSKPAAPVPAVTPAPEPVAEEVSVELRFGQFVSAMQADRTDEAQQALTALKEILPQGSLGLLRAQAWFDLRAQRDDAASEGYRAILERLPGDAEAAINLASIQSRQQKHEDARTTLNDALRLQPESPALRAALAQFTPMAR